MSDTTQDAAPLAGRRQWLGLAALALPTLLVAFDIGVLFLALPHLSADLGATGTQQLWITDIYGFMLAGLLITMGTLGDRIGRRKLLMIGASAFSAASLLAAFSTSPLMLIIARALLGIAAATLSPSTLALISNMFRNPRQMGTAISLWAFCNFGGAALGPVIGGVLLQHFWWGSVFLISIPVMLLLLIAGPILLPEYRDADAKRLDLVSVVWSLAAVLPVVYGIKQLAAGDTSSPVGAYVAVGVGVAFGVVFTRRQLRLPNPLLDLRLFRNIRFSSSLLAMLLASGTLAGMGLLTSQFIQSVLGLEPTEAGLWQAPTGVAIAVGVLVTPVIVRRIQPRTAILGGLTLCFIGLIVLSTVTRTSSPGLVSLSVALVALGIAPMFMLGTNLVVGAAPPEKAGSAASMSETSNLLGSTLGLALLGSVGGAVYQSGMADSPVAEARQTLAEAVSAAAKLPAAQAQSLLDTARNAFTDGLNMVAVVGIVIIAAIFVLVWMTLGQKAATPSASDDLDPVTERPQAAES
ncbi:MFS transporter [Streptomyces sp. CB00316]|uniref:MFS transporter n=1 Tax=unclassified Streptomyces TaxID=2593676 RepID=UPI00093A10B7|nr:MULTISPECIES: MFS transporter [unclassified Streptomyces]MBT2426360.1 MFS transporter [Streptomyces sp. ISL-112]MBT2465277.1 MFS transporter [Streptomyces sp. ISL-63]OKJ09389.1 MFS transporter [Streptomyces sp. CB00316]